MQLIRRIIPFFFFCSLLLAQSSTSITGIVLDPQDAVVPGASVTLTNKATGAVRTVTSDAGGG